jgi:predicted alpha/beta-hydrolase family hydrolase
VFAHGAGAGMTHPSMAAFAEGLAAREVATLRFQFPYMEKGSKRPDPPASRRPRSGRRSMKRRGSAAACPSSPAAARSVAG